MRQKSRVIHFDAAKELLLAFGLPVDGKAYRRLVEGFKRIFASSIYFGTEDALEKKAGMGVVALSLFRPHAPLVLEGC